MWCADNWKDYELLDAINGERFERWGRYKLLRPDPQVIWKSAGEADYHDADGIYRRSHSGGGNWIKNRLPERWEIKYGRLTFVIKAMGFKHTGLFPEQAANWDWFSPLISDAVAQGRTINVLNLFAYTGGATVAAAAAGAKVCHVDAAKGMVAQAKENAALSGLASAPIRYIVDDCRKFLEREIRRGVKYDAIIMDPPSYGRGPSGEIWKIEDSIDEFVGLAVKVLSDDPLFFLINSYTTGLSPSTMEYIANIRLVSKFGGKAISDELGLRVKKTGLALPAGASVRWQSCERKVK